MPYPDIDSYLSNKSNGDFSKLLSSSQADLTRLNELLNNDVEIRGTPWEGAGFEKVTEQYQALTAAMPNSPLMQSIHEEMKQHLFLPSFQENGLPTALAAQSIDFLIKNKKIILRAGWPGHAVLMELIDTGKSIQILVYNSGEGVNAHGNAKSVGNKTKYPPVYALTVNASLSSIKEKDLEKVIAEHSNYEGWKNKRFRWKDWREYTPSAILFRKKCLAYCQLKHFFKSVFERQSGVVETNPLDYYKDLRQFFKQKHMGISLPKSKKMSLSGMDLHATPHRSGGCTIKVWFSAFQRFRAALNKLPARKRKQYYHAKTEQLAKEDYAVTRLKAKCAVAFLTIKKQQDASAVCSLGDAEDNHKIIQNLLDAIAKLSPAQADQFVEETKLLNELNHWLVSEVLPPLKFRLTTEAAQPVLVQSPPGKHDERCALNIKVTKMDPPVASPMWALSSEALQLKEIARWDFSTLNHYQVFERFLQAGLHDHIFKKHPLVLDQAIQQYNDMTKYDVPSDVDSLTKVAEWIGCQLQILNSVMVIQRNDEFDSTTGVKSALLAEKIYLSILRTLEKHTKKHHFDVSKLFNLEQFNLENYAGFLGTPQLKRLARENAAMRKNKIDYVLYPYENWSQDELQTWVFSFFKSMGFDVLELFSDYCRDLEITTQFSKPYQYTRWSEQQKRIAKAGFIFQKIKQGDAGFIAFCKRKKIDFSKLQGARAVLNTLISVGLDNCYSPRWYTETAANLVFTDPYGIYLRRPIQLQFVLAQRTVDNAFKDFYKREGEPTILKEMRRVPGNTEEDLDFESSDLHRTASFVHLTERELSLLKQLKRAYRSPALRWSQGLSVMEQLLPILENVSPHFMRLAMSVIGSDDRDTSELNRAVQMARQKALLNLLDKAERHLAEPELEPAYFSYASLLQMFMIHNNAPADTSWCQKRLYTYSERVQYAIEHADKFSATLVKSASAYQLLDIYRRLVINQDQTNFQNDYRFFIKYFPKKIFDDQSDLQRYVHPDLNYILVEVQKYWMAQWNKPEARSKMEAVIRAEKDIVGFGPNRITERDQISGKSSVFDPWQNKTGARNPVESPVPATLLDSRYGDYFKKHRIVNVLMDDGNYYFKKDAFGFELKKPKELKEPKEPKADACVLHYNGRKYQSIRLSSDELDLSVVNFSNTYLQDDRYLGFMSDDNHCVVLDRTTLDIAYEAQIQSDRSRVSAYCSLFEKKSSVVAESRVPLVFYAKKDRPAWLAFSDPNYVEVTLEHNQARRFDCLQTGLQMEYQAGRWICLQKPGLYCQETPLTFKTPGMTGYLPLVSEDGTLKKVLIPRTPVMLKNERFTQQLSARYDSNQPKESKVAGFVEKSAYDSVEMSTFDYEEGFLQGSTIQDKLHAFYLYSIYGTNDEQALAFQKMLEAGSLDLADPSIQYLLFLIFFGTPCPTDSDSEPTQILNPQLAALRLRLLLHIFSKSMYAQAEMNLDALLSSDKIDEITKRFIRKMFSIPQLTVELANLAAYYYDAERNLPHDKRLTDAEKHALERLVHKPYKEQHTCLQLGQRTPGTPVAGNSKCLTGNPDAVVFGHFSELLQLDRPTTPVTATATEMTADLAAEHTFLSTMHASDTLVTQQQKNTEFLLVRLTSDPNLVSEIQRHTTDLIKTNDEGLTALESDVYRAWCDLQTALGRPISDQPAGEHRKNPSFDMQACVRALFWGELQSLQDAPDARAKEQARVLQERLTQYLLKSVMSKRFKHMQALCKKSHASPKSEAEHSHNQGILRQIAKVLLEKQLPESVTDVRFLVLSHVLGFCLTERQVLAIQDALETGDYSQILEAEMGFGKSEVILTAIALMKGNKLPVLVLPKQLMGLTENAIAKTAGYFGYTFNRIEYQREHGRNKEYFAFLLKTLESAKLENQIIVTDQSSLEALKLSYIEKCNDPENDSESIRNLAKILQYFQNKVQVNQDEFHEQTLEKQFNYAEGEKVGIPAEIQAVILQTYDMMKKSPSLSCYLEDPNLLISPENQKIFKKALKRAYFDDLNSPLTALNLLEHQKHALEQWFDDEIEAPDFVADSYAWHTCKYFFSHVAVNVLKKKSNENFGRNPALGSRMSAMVPIPYVFNEVPALGSEFANPIQLTALTTQLTLLNTIPWDIFKAYFIEKQSYYKTLLIKQKSQLEIESDPQLKILFEIGLGEALKKNMRHEDYWQAIYQAYCSNDDLKKLLLRENILPSIQIHNQYLNDTHQDFVAQVSDYHGVSGTPPKVILPVKAKINPAISKGVFLRVAQLLLRKNAPVYCAPTARLTLNNYFEQTREAVKDKLDRFRVIFDLDNDFQGSAPYTVAKHIHEWLNQEKKPELNNVKVVVFFEKDKAYFISVKDKKATKHLIQDIKSIDKELNLNSMNEAFVYFDQSHCVGVNMKLDSNVFALANTGPRVPVSLYQQMIYRLRELEGEQTVTTVIDETKQEIIQTTEVPPAWRKETCLHDANPELVQLLYHSYQLMMKAEHQGAPIAAQQSLHAILRNAILKASYTSSDPRAVIQAHKALFYVDVDFMSLLKQGTSLRKPIAKQDFYDALRKKYRPLLKRYTKYTDAQIDALLQTIRQQYEPHSEDNILGNEQTIDATAQAQQQVEQNAQQQAQIEQMHQQQMSFGLQQPNTYAKNHFKQLKRWRWLFKSSMSRWIGDGFFSVNTAFTRFKCDPNLLATANHWSWLTTIKSSFRKSVLILKNLYLRAKASNIFWIFGLYIGMLFVAFLPAGPVIAAAVALGAAFVFGIVLPMVYALISGGVFSSLFSSPIGSSYQKKDYNKPFADVLVIRQHGKLYNIVCTIEDVQYFIQSAKQCGELRFMLYSVANKQVIESNDPTLCHLLHAEPTSDKLESQEYRRLHGMRQQLRYLNGDLLALTEDEPHWFFANPDDASEMDRVWSCYETEIKPYHAGQHGMTKEQFDAQIKTRINCTPKAYHQQSRPGLIYRAWILSTRCLGQGIRWLGQGIRWLGRKLSKALRIRHFIYRKVQPMLEVAQGWIAPSTRANRYDKLDDYVRQQVPEVVSLNEMLKHNKPESVVDLQPEEEERHMASASTCTY